MKTLTLSGIRPAVTGNLRRSGGLPSWSRPVRTRTTKVRDEKGAVPMVNTLLLDSVPVTGQSGGTGRRSGHTMPAGS
jgi:hypothetical protein